MARCTTWKGVHHFCSFQKHLIDGGGVVSKPIHGITVIYWRSHTGWLSSQEDNTWAERPGTTSKGLREPASSMVRVLSMMMVTKSYTPPGFAGTTPDM